MKKLGLFFFMLPVFSLGQVIKYDFEDEDLTDWYQNIQDRWLISSDHPVSGSYSLSHAFDNEEAGTDWITLIHLPLELSENNSCWEFSLQYDYNPSANNQWGVFFGFNCIPFDNQSLDNALLFGLNYEGNDDILKLWEISQGKSSQLISTGFNWEEHNLKQKKVNFRLTLFYDHIFQIDIDTSGNDFILLARGEVFRNTPINSFGLRYKYTASYDMGIKMDNIVISGSLTEDLILPAVDNVYVMDQHRIQIHFNTLIRTTPGSGWCVDGVGCEATDKTLFRIRELILPEPIIPGNEYEILLPEYTDLYGKPPEMGNRVSFYYPASNDLIINEIMADPDPQVLLPETEYIELYNRSNNSFSISQWVLTINHSKNILPCRTIYPGEYLLFCDRLNAQLFHDNTLHIIPAESLGSINNNEAEIILQDASGKLIHTALYRRDLFTDPAKKNGGWSLEMTDPDDPCGVRDNWTESVHFMGGTPGKENSVFAPGSMQSNPELWRAAVSPSGSLFVYFSEPLDSLRSSETSFFHVDHSWGSPILLKPSWPVVDRMELFFSKVFEAGTLYELNITNDPCNCGQHPVSARNHNYFKVPELHDSADIIINEIMFDPLEKCREYIELYNRSGKTIEIRDWKIQIGEKSPAKLTDEYFPLLPTSYAIIAADIRGIDEPGRFRDAYKIIEMPQLDVLPNKETSVILTDTAGNTVDRILYDPSWHHELFSETHGISLERISPDRSGFDRENWHSASSVSGCQTPGEENSVTGKVQNPREVFIDPHILTPNGDGRDDILNIGYQLDDPDYMARVFIFDSMGRLQKIIANGSLAGMKGSYLFDGYNDRGEILPTGYYIVYFEAYSPRKRSYRKKLSFIIAVK